MVASIKEFMQGESAQSLQENATCALANISGGLSYAISSVGESLDSCTSPAEISDSLGALASALMIYDNKAESTDPEAVEQILVKQLQSKLPFLVQEHTIEALASLYGNAVLSKPLANSAAKCLLVGLITMATNEVHDDLIRSLVILCNNGITLWHALQGQEGVQLLISLGLSSEQQQECAVALLSLLSNENYECKWAVMASGGIPPLVQILESGSIKAKEDSATILGNLCHHSEDIRACVESANAVPALLWLLKNVSENGKGIAAKTPNHLIHKSDTGTISQLLALLTSDQPESKKYVLGALRSLLSIVPLNDLLRKGSAANDAIEAMIKVLSSTMEEIQAKSALARFGLFSCRKDLRESYVAVKTLWSAMKLLTVESGRISIEASCCLAAIFLSIKQNQEVAVAARDALPPLVLLANSLDIQVAEQATRALANILLDHEISLRAIPEEIIMPVTRVLRSGTIDGKMHAAAAIDCLLQYRSSDHALSDSVNRAGDVLALVTLLEFSDTKAAAISEVLDALALLSRTNGTNGEIKPPWAILSDHPRSIAPLVSCIPDGTPTLQDKAIEIPSRLCGSHPDLVGNAVASAAGCVSSIAKCVIGSSIMKIKVAGAALLVCSAKKRRNNSVEDLKKSS